MTDLYLKNGRTVDGAPIELGITGGQITAVGPKLNGLQAAETIDLNGDHYVSAGWIDDHTHCYEKLTLYYDDPDLDGVPTGVTTVIDAGSTGADNIGDFYRITRDKRTNVYAMINVSKTGILAQDELGDMNRIQDDLITQALADYPDFIVGFKVRESHSVVIDNDVLPLIAGKRIQKANGDLPLMVHVGANPPALKDVLDLLEPGDILTHAYNGKPNGIIDQEGNIANFVWAAYNRGVIFDVGHGTDSFNFKTMAIAKYAGLDPFSLSTDIYHTNRENGPVVDMATCIEKMLLLGYTLPEVIPMITSAPARNFRLAQKGSLAVGQDADVTIFQVRQGHKTLTDSNHNDRETDTLVVPTHTIVAGTVYTLEG
ncbi:amidohydrolase/deacetylase family metallohydrolase [Lacticaseibacillus absianus]|uniref:amidohydrolase/deacetylase family metallohydrolase n=1 Tax=Lacticaseibacillus absianus TaxID=2729623 RepID=UPI0015CA9A2B|nr:amidohydrolase/deacetylase family metallohydrolase [Lacticaseibacillus absianus]